LRLLLCHNGLDDGRAGGVRRVNWKSDHGFARMNAD
jgi:hypothetical protein